jgi:uncharacterized membrane-anchored protein
MDSASDQPTTATAHLRPSDAGPRHARRARTGVSKVPEITALFWLTKLVTTAMGEATSDYLVKRFGDYPAVGLGFLALAAALVLQFSVRRYVPWVYWLAVAMVATAGTMAADVLHLKFGVPYDVSTPLFAVALAVVFVVWNATEKTLSIHSITTPRREVFYWLTVMATFALGTAAGDMAAKTMNLGYFTSALVFIGIILIPALGYRFLKFNGILAFWFAYVVTRPIGASFADWMSKARSLSGLGWGDGNVAIALTLVLAVLVAYLTILHTRDRGTPASPRAA